MSAISNDAIDAVLQGTTIEKRFQKPTFFGDDSVVAGFHVNNLFVPGTNIREFDSSSTWNVLRFHLLRITLSTFHDVYGYALRVRQTYEGWRDWIIVLVLFRLVECGLIDFTVATLTSIYKPWGDSVKRYASTRGAPETSEAIQLALADCDAMPTTIVAVLSMSLYLKPHPQPVPQPFLTAEKKIKVPSEKEVRRAVAQRAEWSVGLSTHLAAETIQILTEAAKLVSWLSCMRRGQSRVVYLYLKRPGFWTENGQTLADLLTGELQALNGYLPPVNLLNFHDGTRYPLGGSMSGVMSGLLSPPVEEATLTVFLVQDDYKQQIVHMTKALCNDQISLEQVHSALDSFATPDLVLTTFKERHHENCLVGFPIQSKATDTHFHNLKKPFQFSDFVSAVQECSRLAKTT